MSDRPAFELTCPAPAPPGDRVLLAHGEGGRLSRRLIRDLFLAELDNELLRPLGDGAVLPPIDGRAAFSTDSYVVSPLFFPGGDIGKLAVHGTVNDLACCGAEPMYLSLGLIVEEGLPLETLRQVARSVREAALSCGVNVVTGDTKVVPRGAADGLFVNTAGIGRVRAGVDLGPHRVRAGDRVLISGTVGDHGITVLSAREGLDLEGLSSDTAPVHALAAALFDAGIGVRFLRDPTRGGVAAVVHELAEAARAEVVVNEADVPLSPAVRGASELLGLDALHVANEGKLLAVVAQEDAEEALSCWRRLGQGAAAALIGDVARLGQPRAVVRGPLGGLRLLDEPSGAPLPRIC